jgi:hypothetical protein
MYRKIMFDGTDLSLVYGNEGGGNMNQDIGGSSFQQQKNNQNSHGGILKQVGGGGNGQPSFDQIQEPVQQSSVPPDMPYIPPEQMYTHEVPKQQGQGQGINVAYKYQPSFWDKMNMKKGDVFKLVMYSLVILLALSLHKFGNYYLKHYINENIFTWNQEFLIRLSYPVAIILLIWVLKSV